MNSINLYDTIKLGDNCSYAVIGITDYDEKTYYLLSKVLDNDELSCDEFRFVEYFDKDGRKFVKVVKDKKVLSELGKLFTNQINNVV